MDRAGDVVRITQGVAVVRCDGDDHPEFGATIINQNLNEIGRIVDVFGPVNRPYLAVTPDDNVHLPGLIGQTLYVR